MQKKTLVIEKTTNPYTFVCSDETLKTLHQYRLDLLTHKVTAGKYLADKLVGKNLNTLTDEQFIELLVQTKPDRIFAESTLYSPKLNWSAKEISLLGDLSCIIPTKAYDNGAWNKPTTHKTPLDVTLVYVPGPLLRSGYANNETPDLDEVCPRGTFDSEAYYHMLERRLLPGLLHTNGVAAQKGEELFVTLPGIGCGQFSGKFGGIIHNEFEKTLHRLLTEHGSRLTQVKAVWYDNFNKEPATKHIHGIDFLVRPLTKGGLPQLCTPAEYGDKYAQCKLVSLVAWDHVSKPGNDYWEGARTTDDGVKGAATDTMPALTGLQGAYQGDRVVPKDAPNKTWSQYTVEKGGISLKVAGRFNHYPVSVQDSPPSLIKEIKNPEPLKRVNLSLQQSKFNQLLSNLKSLINELTRKKALNSAQYNTAYNKVYTLHNMLTEQADKFFKNPTPENFKDFNDNCNTEIANTERELKKHRGVWFQIHPVLRGILGVISTFTILPTLIVALTNRGYAQTFFVTPETESAKQFETIKTKEHTIADEIEQTMTKMNQS